EELQAEVNEIIVKYRDKQIAEEIAAAKRRTDAMQGALRHLGSLTNTESKKLFEIGKAAQIAMAAVEGSKSVMSAYKWGMELGGPPLAAAFAGAAVAATANMINHIRKQQFRGSTGGGAPIAASQ